MTETRQPYDAGLHPGYHIICRVNGWQVGVAGGAAYFLHDDGRRVKARDQAEVLEMARLINQLRDGLVEAGRGTGYYTVTEPAQYYKLSHEMAREDKRTDPTAGEAAQ